MFLLEAVLTIIVARLCKLMHSLFIYAGDEMLATPMILFLLEYDALGLSNLHLQISFNLSLTSWL